MEKPELLAIINVLARQAKSHYRELLAHRMFAQYLKNEGYRDVDEIIESARQSAEIQAAGAKYDQAIDAKIPPSDEELLDEALKKWLASLPSAGLPN
ncbi:MAG: hypothetical protein WCF17_03790 [Terracidiphilus sp.]